MKAILEMEDAHRLITFQNATMMVEIVVQPQVAHQQAHLQAAQDQVHHQVARVQVHHQVHQQVQIENLMSSRLSL